MAGVDPNDLQELAAELLQACVLALDTIPDTYPDLVGAPARHFISPGEPAADECCDLGQLTVHVLTLTEAPTEPSGQGGQAIGRRATYGRLNHVGLTVTLFRCIPVGMESRAGFTPPEASSLEAAAQQLNADAWALWNHVYNRIRAHLLFSKCRGVFWDGMRSIPPSGACGGWVMAFRIVLDGYEEDGLT